MLTEIEKEVSASTPNVSSTQGKSHVSRLITELNPNEPMSEKPQILDEVVIEEVSIDGMCGVY
ncbi:MAG TPA: variant-type mycofactocin precursor [Hyphomicrobiaceae bacterium]|jgi:mycofactocin precursor|nr:variant-type mycofactocin precursor [Hyphomicrobiaceae bacterium]